MNLTSWNTQFPLLLLCPSVLCHKKILFRCLLTVVNNFIINLMERLQMSERRQWAAMLLQAVMCFYDKPKGRPHHKINVLIRALPELAKPPPQFGHLGPFFSGRQKRRFARMMEITWWKKRTKKFGHGHSDLKGSKPKKNWSSLKLAPFFRELPHESPQKI